MLENAPPSPGEVRALASQLLSWADRLATRTWTGHDLPHEDEGELLLALAVAERELGRRRSRIFADAAFDNPTWEVFVDLYVQEAHGYRVSLDHLALSGDLHAETVYECVGALVAAGLVERVADRFDKRIEWLSLSSAGKRGMVEFLLESTRFVRPCTVGDGEPAAG